MNDALRLLRKILRSCGYDIKERYSYNLLPIQKIREHSQLDGLYRANDRPPSRKAKEAFNLLFVCLRTCIREDNHKSHERRLTGTDHKEIVFRCINSLVQTINNAVINDPGLKIIFIIFDDHSDSVDRQKIEDIQKKTNCECRFITTQNRGQGCSLIEQFEFARERDGLFYFCEDDYLHELSAIEEMVRFYRHVYEKFDTHLVLHPQEHEFLYLKSLYPSYFLLGEKRHWRTISHATHVLFLHSLLVKKYWEYFINTRFVGNRKKRRLGAESKTTDRLFNHVPGFAPVPAIAAHIQNEKVLPPFFDWRRLWEQSKLDD